MELPRPAFCSSRTVWPWDTRIATPDGVMPTRNSCVLISLGTPMRIGLASIGRRWREINRRPSRDRDAARERPVGRSQGAVRAHSLAAASSSLPWHFLYFLPEPHGHGSLRPTFGLSRLTGSVLAPSPAVRALPGRR